MLYNLLFPFSDRVPLFNVLRYPSFRMLMAGLVSLVIGLFLGPSYIDALRRLQHGASNVREDTPEAHQRKVGTPSMGGGLILWAMLVGTLLFADLTNRMVWAALIITLGFGAIGFADDWLKFSKRNSKGLAGRKKLLWQTIIFVVVVAVFFVDWKHGTLYLDTRLAIPFVKVKAFNPVLPWLIYLPFACAEIVSVMLQVFWSKRPGRGIFRMAPIHHHFELQGWAEPKIIVRFWIVSIILALTALASLKLR